MRKWMKKFAVTLTILLVILGNYGLPIFSLVVQADDSISFTTEIIEDAQTHEQSVRITGIEGNVEPSDHTLVIPEQLVVGTTTYDVTEIGDQAFIGKHLTNVTFLGEKLSKIGNYAFADNQLTSLTLPDSLKEIGEYAFRDNEVEHLALTHVTTLGKQAFANNKLKTIQLGEVTTIGDEGFTNNQLTTVEIGNAVTSFGTGVFGFNNRFVEVKTTNPLIQNEVVANNGYGHVVNPVTVTVEFLKPDGTKLTEDQTIGSDFYDYNGVIMLGKENTYKPQPMLGYMPEQSEIKYTPDSTNYVLKVKYIEAKNPEITEKKALTIERDQSLTKEQLLSYFTIQDFKGSDLSSRATFTPETISAVGRNENDRISVTISVTDDLNKSSSKQFEFIVTPNILDFPLGKILANDTEPYSKDRWWTLGDFSYDGNKVVDFSTQGHNKVQILLNQEEHDDFQIIFPHLNPYTGGIIDEIRPTNVGNYPFSVYNNWLRTTVYRITDYAGNIKKISQNPHTTSFFYHFELKNFDENTFPNLEEISTDNNGGRISIELRGPLSKITHNSLKVGNLDFVGYGSTASGNKIDVSFPKLKTLNLHFARGNYPVSFKPDSFSSVENIIGLSIYNQDINKNVTSFNMPKLVKIRNSDDYSSTFNGFENPEREDKKIVIYTDAQNLPSKENYLINPIEDGEQAFHEFNQEDFIFADATKETLLGFSARGVANLKKLNDDSALTDIVLNLPASVKKIEDTAFKSFSTSKITKIIGPNVEYIGKQSFQNFFANEQLALIFPKLKEIKDHAFFSWENDKVIKLTEWQLPELTTLGIHAISNFQFGTPSQPLERFAFPKLKELGSDNFTNVYTHEVDLPSLESWYSSYTEVKNNKLLKKIVLGPKASLADNIIQDTRPSGDYVHIFIPNNHQYDQLGYNGEANNTKNFVVNPIKVTIHNIDNNNQPLRSDKEFYIHDYTANSSERILYASEIYGYRLLETKVEIKNEDGTWSTSKNYNNTYTIPNDKSKSEYVLTFKQTLSPIDTSVHKNGLKLEQDNEPIMKNPSGGTYPYHIGDIMLTKVKASISENTVNHPRIKVFYNPTYVEAVTAARYGLVNNIVNNSEDGVLTIDLNAMSGSTSIEIPIQWRFKKYVTPDNYELPIHAYIVKADSGEEISYVANDISLKGTYDKPNMLKHSPQNMPDHDYGYSKDYDDGIRYFGTHEAVRDAQGMFVNRIDKDQAVSFDYTVQALERNVNELTVVDQLPTYSYVNDDGTIKQAKAIFIPEENPKWTQHGDQLIAHVEGFEGTTSVDRFIPRLKLHFPHLLINSNVENRASITLVPENIGPEEELMVVADRISIYQPNETKQIPIGEIHFWKNNRHEPWYYEDETTGEATTYFYDIQKDREKTIPFLVQTYSINQTTTFKNARITDYNLDNRLYYTGIEVADDSFGAIPEADSRNSIIKGMNDDDTLSQVKIVAYGAGTTATMNPATDPILQSQSLSMVKGAKVEFNPSIAKNIKYVQIILPADYIVNNHMLRFNVLTKLRNPDVSLYDATVGSLANKFNNEALLSGDVTSKFTGESISSRNNPFSAVGKPYQSIWDGIEGNFLWQDEASVNIRPYKPSVGIEKTHQLASDGFIAKPGSSVQYELKLTPKIADRDVDSKTEDLGFKLNDFQLVDIIPQGIYIEKVNLASEFLEQPNASYQIVNNYEGTGKQAIVFTASQVRFGIKEIATIDASVDVDIGTIQSITNKAYLTFSNRTTTTNPSTNNSIDLNGIHDSPTGINRDNWVVGSTNFAVLKNKEMVAKKYIRKLDGLWSTDIIETNSTEAFEYRLLLVNNADTDQKHISVMDMFPYKDDRFIQELNVGEGIRTLRQSEFHNYFDTSRQIKVMVDGTTLSTSKYQLFYDNATPYTYDYTGISDIEGLSINWEAVPNAQNTKAIKFVGADDFVLRPGQKLEIILPMKAPNINDPTQVGLSSGQIAYNTFVRKDDDSLRYIEANKVGNRLTDRRNITFRKFLKEGYNGTVEPANSTDKQATFKISSKDDSIVQIKKTDTEGRITFTNLPVDRDYVIKEVTAPTGYSKSFNKLEITSEQLRAILPSASLSITDGQSQATFLNRKEIKGNLTIRKKDASGNALAGIRFELKGKRPGSSSWDIEPTTLITNSEGIAWYEGLSEGTYTIREIVDTNATDFEPIAPKEFTISKDSSRDFEYSFVNNTVHVLLQKLGVRSSEELSDLASLTDSNKKKLANYTFTISDQTNSQSKDYTTDSDGKVIIPQLSVNKVYKIVEKQSGIAQNSKYQYNNKAYYFYLTEKGKLMAVDDWNKTNERPFKQNVLNFPNQLKTLQHQIIIQKEDDRHQPVVGAIFGLYRNEQLVQTAISKMKDSGKAVAEFNQLSAGTYVLRELKAPDGYIMAGNDQIITLPDYDELDTSSAENSSVLYNEQTITYKYQKTCINHRIRVNVYKGEMLLSNISEMIAQQAKAKDATLIIQSLGNGYANVYRPIQGVEFKLYKQEGESWTYQSTFSSDENGKIDLSSYTFDGTKVYQLVESKAAKGYQLDTQPLKLDFPTLSQSNDFDGEITLYKNNRQLLGKVTISKYAKKQDGSKKVLAGAVFELYDAKNNLINTATTDETGNAYFDQLPFGEYVIKERPMEGYKTNTVERKIVINQDVQNLSLIYVNEEIQYKTISVTKKWLGIPKVITKNTGENVTVTDTNNFDVTLYLLEPAITDEGIPVYRYSYSRNRDGELSSNNILRILDRENGFTSTFENLPILNDPYGRDYRITEYSPREKNSYGVDAETATFNGKPLAIFTEANRDRHKISIDYGGYNYSSYAVINKNSYTISNADNSYTVYNENLENVVSVGDYVFIDKNNNHLQDADEKGLAGVKVIITNSAGSNPTYYNNEGTQVTAPYTTTTNEQGYYAFRNLIPGEYKIHFELTPEQVNRGYVLVDKGDGTNPTIDSNANPDGWTDVFNLQPNANKTANPMGDYLDNPTIDAGVREGPPLVSLGDYVFIDTNGNHLQDSTDQPLAAVSVKVLKADGSNPEWFNGTDFVTDPYITTTDATGHYQFTNLKPDTYKVQFTLTEAQSKLYAYVSPNVGDNDALDSDAVADKVNPSVGLTEAKAVSDLTIPQDTANAPNPLGLNNPTFDAGVTLRVDQLVSLGDKVFVDMDNSNTQTEGDLPLANMKVKVVNADGTSPTYAQNGRLVTQEYTTTTDEQGYYHFDQLVPGNYKVIFELTPEQQQIYRFVTPDDGGNDALDSDAKVVNPAISYVAETSAQEVQPTTSPPDSPTAPNPLGLTNPSFDAGVRLDAERLVSLGDYVFIDVDGSQTQTASDQPLPNVSVEVRTADGQLPTYLKNGQLVTDVYTTTTDLNGRYQFNHLLPGSYKVYFTLNEEQKSKYQFIAPNVGGDKTKDSDATVIDPLRPERAVTAADVVNNDLTIRNRADNPFHLDNPDFDAGVAVINQLVSVGDYVFIDRDGSNTQTPGDRPLPNVTVSIVKVNSDGTTTDPTYMKNGELITAPYTTKTDQDGLYSFIDLVPGDYQVIFTLSDTQKQYYHYVTPEVGGAPSLDSDAHVDGENSAIGRSKVIHLVADPFVRNGENNPLHLDNPTIDAGVVGPDYELPGAGKMELWFWYLASMSMLLIGLALFFGNRKRQLVAIQTMPVSTMTSNRFTNIRQDETQSDIMEMENQVTETTESLRHSTDHVRPSEDAVSDMLNVDAVGETVENRLHRSEKIVDSGEKKSSAADVEVDDPPPERPPQNKHPSSGPFSST